MQLTFSNRMKSSINGAINNYTQYSTILTEIRKRNSLTLTEMGLTQRNFKCPYLDGTPIAAAMLLLRAVFIIR